MTVISEEKEIYATTIIMSINPADISLEISPPGEAVPDIDPELAEEVDISLPPTPISRRPSGRLGPSGDPPARNERVVVHHLTVGVINPPPSASMSPVPPITLEENEDATSTIDTVEFGHVNEGMSSVPQTPSGWSRNEEGFFINDTVDYPPETSKRRASISVSEIAANESKGGGFQRRSSVVTIAPGLHDDKIEPTTSKRGSLFGSRRFRKPALTPQRSLRRYLTREILPHVDNYRSRRSFAKGKIFIRTWEMSNELEQIWVRLICPEFAQVHLSLCTNFSKFYREV